MENNNSGEPRQQAGKRGLYMTHDIVSLERRKLRGACCVKQRRLQAITEMESVDIRSHGVHAENRHIVSCM